VEEHGSSAIQFTVLELGPLKNKMVQSFGDAFATARVEGVFTGHGFRQKYRVKWTNLSEELIREYGANHRLFQDPSKEWPLKAPIIHGPLPLSLDAAESSPAVPNMADALELYPSSDEESEPHHVHPQIPGISPLQIYLISHLLVHTNAGIAVVSEQISGNEMKKWIGIMFAMTLSPIFNIKEYWREENEGFIPAHSFGIKSGLSKERFKFIRKHLATGAIGGGAKTFDAFRPIQTFFNDRVADCLCPGHHIVIDESA
jgi:hypothetical protein